MRKPAFYILLILLAGQTSLSAQNVEVFLITCGPGTATYSIYGHSALRIINHDNNSDLVYNWGVFDFGTPNFVWKFAKGRLNYMLGVYPYETFLRDYFFEERWVISQKINLDDEEISRLFALIAENMKPENISYRYDFFYDNCSTRIRDLLEKAVGERLYLPPEETKRLPSFRNLIHDYQKGYPWLNFGIDLLMGVPADKKATVRDRMFLPLEMKSGLSAAVVSKNNKMIPLLRNPVSELEFGTPGAETRFLTSPIFIFTLILILMIIISGLLQGKKFILYMDVFLFLVFSVLAIIMIFFNFFTDHQQLSWNLNIIWLNPFNILCLTSLIFNRGGTSWFRAVFYLSCAFLLYPLFLTQQSNHAFVPLIITMIFRSSVRAGFAWNPLSKPYLT